MSVIVAEQLVKYYDRKGKKPALNGVSFEVSKGEVSALLGPNGSGKTTSIRIVMGLIYPNEGKVSVLGQNPFSRKEIFREIGYVQELPNLPPFMSGREVLEMSCSIKGIDKAEVGRVLELVGMKEFADRKIAKYSKGMTQRIAIAEALLGNPSLLIMDEPNIGTDPIINLKIREIIEGLKRGGTSVFMTSHQLDDVRKMADTVYLIYRGRVFFRGSVEDMIKKFLGVVVIVDTSTPEKLQEVVKNVEYVTISDVKKRGQDYRFTLSLKEDRREELSQILITQGVKVKDFFINDELDEAYERAMENASKEK
ncbi:putative branched-chain amino acid transport ATP-binding protein LivG [Sulfuracidifex tepidarius]|uniref:Branched-chain amino acid transport ATP-binding protein LivG n=1 Tax=Sulfuracidifex tepidarius TaxID=1294262 RepID=A0A510DRW9_9CREN|nr:ABC transporter ATP-binding protein [Sulfuracidifex tepidarius]BBG22917.1 putative branched-chain amino acid transport ATP-binding protein LivG [Sulfuracidifex tepidarius]